MPSETIHENCCCGPGTGRAAPGECRLLPEKIQRDCARPNDRRFDHTAHVSVRAQTSTSPFVAIATRSIQRHDEDSRFPHRPADPHQFLLSSVEPGFRPEKWVEAADPTY